MSVIVQWATLLSPIVAVLLAWWTVRSSAKDTAKKIAAIEKSTEKQIESIKKLARIQIKTSQIQLNKELYDTRIRFLQTDRKEVDLLNDEHNFYQSSYSLGSPTNPDKISKKRELSYEKDYYQHYIKGLEVFQKSLSELSKEMENE